MKSLHDNWKKGELREVYELYGFMINETLDEAIKHQERLLKNNPDDWKDEDQDIYKITQRCIDGSKERYCYEDVKREIVRENY